MQQTAIAAIAPTLKDDESEADEPVELIHCTPSKRKPLLQVHTMSLTLPAAQVPGVRDCKPHIWHDEHSVAPANHEIFWF